MELNLAANPLYQEEQILTVDKVATLIGENGSGKSSILQSIFEGKLRGADYDELKIVCFSSGQNENYSKQFGKYLTRQRKANANLTLNSFYYDKTWSKILIFLATCLYSDGKVRQFLREHEYVEEAGGSPNDDTSTNLNFKFKVPKEYAERVQTALKEEETGETTETMRSSAYFRSLESFIASCIDNEYEFESALSKRTITLNSHGLFSASYSASLSVDEEHGEEEGTILFQNNPTVSFFTQAADNNYFIDKANIHLNLKRGLELDDLSDGEYQILFLYALIDLFDTENTLFLLDEADSHLHYKNIERLWDILHGIEGYAITTTHLLDSITANEYGSLKVVEKGKITETDKIKQLINRLGVLARAKSVEFEVCAKIPNMALLDDYNDWAIFKRLAQRKGLDIARIETVQAVKKTSSYATTTEEFAKSKLAWIEGLSKAECGHETSKVFLICDRDEAPLEFHQNGVTVNGANYRDQINAIHWPHGTNVRVHLLAWKRREIKNYLLSFTALTDEGKIDEINNANLAVANHLNAGEPADNEGIRRLAVKDTIDPVINADGHGLDIEKLDAYIAKIPPDEISVDIENMFNFITENL